MESNLNCLASNCIYNENGYCFASYININGLDATFNDETNCDTYLNSTQRLTAMEKQIITTTQNINCNAKNCTYNIFGSCNCSHVIISRDDMKCENFRVKN